MNKKREKMARKLDQLRVEYTPEGMLMVDPNVDPDSIDDVLMCGLCRMGAIVDLMQANIAGSGEFSVSMNSVRNSLWAIEGDISMMKMLIRKYDSHAQPVCRTNRPL